MSETWEFEGKTWRRCLGGCGKAVLASWKEHKACGWKEGQTGSVAVPEPAKSFNLMEFRDEFKLAQEETRDLVPDGFGGNLPFNPTDVLLYMLLKKTK